MKNKTHPTNNAEELKAQLERVYVAASIVVTLNRLSDTEDMVIPSRIATLAMRELRKETRGAFAALASAKEKAPA